MTPPTRTITVKVLDLDIVCRMAEALRMIADMGDDDTIGIDSAADLAREVIDEFGTRSTMIE